MHLLGCTVTVVNVPLLSEKCNKTTKNQRSWVHNFSSRRTNFCEIYVNNQQDATTFTFINLFKSAQHVSGDKFAHPQEHFFDCIYSFWYNAPVGSRGGALYRKLYIQSKRAPEDGRIFRPKHEGLI